MRILVAIVLHGLAGHWRKCLQMRGICCKRRDKEMGRQQAPSF